MFVFVCLYLCICICSRGSRLHLQLATICHHSSNTTVQQRRVSTYIQAMCNRTHGTSVSIVLQGVMVLLRVQKDHCAVLCIIYSITIHCIRCGGISASPEALTRDVIHLAWHIHIYSHIQMLMTVYRDDDDTIQFLKLETRIGNVPRVCFEKLL